MFRRLMKRFLNYVYMVDIDTLINPPAPQLYYYTQKGYKPRRSTEGALCFDVTPYLPNGNIILNPNEVAKIRTGLYFDLPEDYDIFIRDRSGNATNKRILVANRVGVLDNDYRGELLVPLYNAGTEPFEVIETFKMAQIEIRKRSQDVEWVEIYSLEELSKTSRGGGGFGSTDDKSDRQIIYREV